jgi:hypothetical protein
VLRITLALLLRRSFFATFDVPVPEIAQTDRLLSRRDKPSSTRYAHQDVQKVLAGEQYSTSTFNLKAEGLLRL